MRLLLVEDEKRMADALCEILRLEKYDVDCFYDGKSGLYAIESGIYDAIIIYFVNKNFKKFLKNIEQVLFLLDISLFYNGFIL